MNYPFITDYTALPVNIALNISIGLGLYRIYITSNSPIFIASNYGVDNVISIEVINDTVFLLITDETSTNVMVLRGPTIPSGTVLYGNYSFIKISTGMILKQLY